MSNYKIIYTEPAEEGYVYVDVLINDSQDSIRLILPNDPEEAKQKMADYLAIEDGQVQPDAVSAETPLDVLVDQTIEV
jgi:hypothetical protein